MKIYHHVGIPTKTKKDGETYYPHLKIHASGFETSEYGIEWVRFDSDCFMPKIIQTIPHVCFKVDDITKELKNKKILVEPYSPSEGIKVAFIEENGAPIELLMFDNESKK